MRPEDDIKNVRDFPQEYYDQLVAMGSENLCRGRYVEDFGYIIPEVNTSTIQTSPYETFHDINFTNTVVLPYPAGRQKVVTFVIKESKYKEVFNHHVLAIFGRGKPTLLTYDSDRKKNSNKRYHATKTLPSMGRKSLIERDEYPYACTKEGGLGASVMYVSQQQNWDHGQDINKLVRENKLVTDDKIQVILEPDHRKKQPQTVPYPAPALDPQSIKNKDTRPVLPSVSGEVVRDVGTAAAIGAFLWNAVKVIGTIGSRLVSPILMMPMPLDPSLYQQNMIDGEGPIV